MNNLEGTVTVAFADEDRARIDALTKALDDSTAVAPAAEPTSKPAAKGKGKGKAKDDEPEGPTRDDVREKLKEYAAIEGKAAAIAILKDNGAASITELAEESFVAVIKACGD